MQILKTVFSIFFLFIILILFTASKNQEVINHFKKLKSVALSLDLKEQSGLAESRLNPGLVYVHEDSGNPNKIYAFDHTGNLKTSIYLPTTFNRDWEDICVSTGPEKEAFYIYLADIGNNMGFFKTFFIYRFKEKNYNKLFSKTDTLKQVDKLVFNYPDKPKDAEALMVNPATKDIYIITKEKDKAQIFLMAYPQKTESPNELKLVCTLPFNQVTGADISSNGKQIIMRNLKTIWYWNVNAKKSIGESLQNNPQKIDFEDEPQGEGICFSKQLNGLITSTEIKKDERIKPFLTFFVATKN